MRKAALIAAAALLAPLSAQAGTAVPRQLDDAQAAAYRTVFDNIRQQKWLDARLMLATMPPGPLHAIARAELMTAKGSPRAEVADILTLLAEAPELPQADQLARMARSRGATEVPQLPYVQALNWVSGAPVRSRAKPTRSDAAAATLAIQMQPFVKEDRGEDAQALLEANEALLTPEALTEWRQKVAFIYYVAGNDTAARTLAARAGQGYGEWAVHAHWVEGLAAWRQRDCAAAGAAFDKVATRASDTELRAAGLYWAARADMACARPERIEARLKNAAQLDETFYGLLSRQALGIREKGGADLPGGAAWQQLAQRPNARVAAALAEIGEDELADEVVRQQAKIGDPREFAVLTTLAGNLDLPGTQLWLSNNVPQGARTPAPARYPAPNWTPDGGWRIDRNLAFAHTLQESRWRTSVVSPAGAYGLMQVRPIAAADISRITGKTYDRASLYRPSTNLELGQSYIEKLRDQPGTGGLLPKVIAAYNAGPSPVQAWNAESRDGGDPLLYIESIPYWETRGYVAVVLRNYWMYERNSGKASASRSALAQGLWPRFPGLSGANAVRLSTPVAPPRLRPVTLPPVEPVLPAVAMSSGATTVGSR